MKNKTEVKEMKCKKCGGTLGKKMGFCPVCGSKIRPPVSVGKTIARDVGTGLSNVISTGIKVFSQFPKNIQYILCGMMLLCMGVFLPWRNFGLNLVSSALSLGGIILAITGFGLIKKPTKEKKDVSKT